MTPHYIRGGQGNGQRYEGGRGGQQKCRCIWGHTNWERQTDWPGEKERREMEENQ